MLLWRYSAEESCLKRLWVKDAALGDTSLPVCLTEALNCRESRFAMALSDKHVCISVQQGTRLWHCRLTVSWLPYVCRPNMQPMLTWSNTVFQFSDRWRHLPIMSYTHWKMCLANIHTSGVHTVNGTWTSMQLRIQSKTGSRRSWMSTWPYGTPSSRNCDL